jgi:hypothetical protein
MGIERVGGTHLSAAKAMPGTINNKKPKKRNKYFLFIFIKLIA